MSLLNQDENSSGFNKEVEQQSNQNEIKVVQTFEQNIIETDSKSPDLDLINVCPFCNSPVYYEIKNKRNPEEKTNIFTCNVCKKGVIPALRKRNLTYSISKKQHKKELGDDEIISKIKLIELLNSYNSQNSLRDKALICTLYLTAARVEEVVGFVNQKSRELIYRPLHKGQISLEKSKNNVDILVFKNLVVLKRKKKHGNFETRTVPIIIEKEKYFVDILIKYLELIEPEQPLFKMTYQNAWRISKKFMIQAMVNNMSKETIKGTGILKFNAFNHYWRHLRITHLASEYRMSDLQLRRYVGWANAEMASKYAHLNYEDLVDAMTR